MSDKKSVIAFVTRISSAKTLVAECDFYKKHQTYGKYIKRVKKFLVHDQFSVAKLGDKIEIVETRPISKTKNWALVKVVI